MISQRIHNNFKLLIIFLTISFIVKIIFFNISNWLYTYDEILVLDISTQKTSHMLDTLLAEPHPPGFYILISLFTKIVNPFLFPNIIKTIFISINFILWLIVLYYAKNKGVVNNLFISFFVLFFSMFGVFRINTEIKQDLFSLPLLFFLVITLIAFIRSNISNRDAMFNTFGALFILLFLGYINFFIGVIFTIITIFILNFRTELTKIVLLILSIFTGYLYFYGWRQYIFNKTRFGWFDEYVSNFFHSTVEYMTFSDFPIRVLFLQIGIYLLAFFFGSFIFYKNYKNLFNLYLLSLIILLLVFSYFKIFLNVRYALLIHSLISVIVAIGLAKIVKFNQYLLFMLIFVFYFIPTSVGYFKNLNYLHETTSIIVKSYDRNTPTGLLTQHSIAAYGLQKRFDVVIDTPIVPLSKELKDYKYIGRITKEILAMDSINREYTSEEIKIWLQKTALNQFIYILDNKDLGSKYDRNLIVFNTLKDNCEANELIIEEEKSWIYLFKSCFVEIKFANRSN